MVHGVIHLANIHCTPIKGQALFTAMKKRRRKPLFCMLIGSKRNKHTYKSESKCYGEKLNRHRRYEIHGAGSGLVR
jgi:hypothetical protein